MKEIKELIEKKNRFNVYELENSFDEAMKDYDFKKVVSKIKLPKDELMKYTSLFKDSAKELKNCVGCENIMECKNTVTGHVYYPNILQDNIVFSYIPCKYKKKLDEESSYQNNIITFDMPSEILGASMKDIYNDYKNRL